MPLFNDSIGFIISYKEKMPHCPNKEQCGIFITLSWGFI